MQSVAIKFAATFTDCLPLSTADLLKTYVMLSLIIDTLDS